jgi:hypothetical protein
MGKVSLETRLDSGLVASLLANDIKSECKSGQFDQDFIFFW